MEVIKIPEPGLEFYRNYAYTMDDPRYGLEKLGPFDKDTKNFREIKAVVLGPSNFENPFRSFWKKLLEGLKTKQPGDMAYQQGFQDFLQVDKITGENELKFYSVDKHGGDLKSQYEAGLAECMDDKDPDAMVLLIQPYNEKDFGFRDELKLKLLREKIRSQFIRPQTIQKKDYMGSVLNNFAVGLYAKYGGTPWRLKDPKYSNTVVLGISFHVVRASRFDAPERTIFGFSEIVDEFGHHVGMVINPMTLQTTDFKELYNRRSLYIPKEVTKTLVENSIKKYLQRTNQTVPSKLIIHKTTPYHPEEVQGIKDGMAKAGFQGEFAMVHLKNDTGYKTYRKDNYESMRGVFLKPVPGSTSFGVLWTVGKIPERYKRDGEWVYWDKGKVLGTANPIGISLHRESSLQEMDIDFLAEHTLALTKMRWNTVEPVVRDPVSIFFAKGGGKFLSKIWSQHNKEIDVLTENLDARFLL